MLRDRLTSRMPINQVSGTVKLKTRPYHIISSCKPDINVSKQVGKRQPIHLADEIIKGTWLLCAQPELESGSPDSCPPCIRNVCNTLVIY